MTASRAFSLLEVVIALAIFGLMITGVLAATNKKAADVGQAIALARCKMSEIEEKLLRDGYQDLDDIQNDVICCEGVEATTYVCDTKVEKVVLPDPPTSNAMGDGGFDPLGASPSASALTGLTQGPAGGAPTDIPFSAQLDLDAGLGNIAAALGPQAGGQGAAGLVNMVMGFVYPTMKPLMENSIRKVTVNVRWKEGPKSQSFLITQYVTNPARGGFIPGLFPSASASGGAGVLPPPSTLQGQGTPLAPGNH